MRTSTIPASIALVLSLAACEPPATAPEAPAAEGPVLSHGADPLIETTYLLTFTGLTPISETVLPSGVVIQENEFSFVISGDWIGTVGGTVRQVINTNARILNEAVFTFQGTVLGREGTVEYRHASVFDVSGAELTVERARDVILRGTGELEGLRGRGTSQHIGGGVFEGVFHVRFAP